MRTLKRKLFRYDKSSNTFGFLKSSSFFNLSGSFRILSLRLFFFFLMEGLGTYTKKTQ